jgi:O-acetylserine/cysteine efflux transporter
MAPQDLLLALLIDLVWGLNFVAAKIGVTEIPPLLFIALRFTLVFILLARFLRIKPGMMRQILLVACFSGLFHFSLIFTGTHLANASVAAILAQLQLPFATLLSIVWLKEVVGWRRWLGIALALIGIVILGFDPLIFHYRAGAVLVIAAALSMAIAQIFMRRMKDVTVFELQAWVAAISAPGVFILSLVFERGQFAALAVAPHHLYAILAYTAIGASIFGQGGMFFLLKRYDVSLVATLTVLAQVFGIIFGVVLLHEPMTWRVAIGAGVICVGVAIIALRQGKAAVPIPAAAPVAPAIAEPEAGPIPAPGLKADVK